MSLHAISHFQNLLGPYFLPPPLFHSPPTWFAQLSAFSPSHEQIVAMSSIPSAEEIQQLMFKLNPNKAPGPDGLTLAFYKSTWSFLGTEVLSSITHFFQQSFLPGSTNSTILSLVPKCPGASLITDFRPISCLNTLYKVIKRLLVRRIKPLLPTFIVPNQTTFCKREAHCGEYGTSKGASKWISQKETRWTSLRPLIRYLGNSSSTV
ncbi:hypothetical protein Bca101_026858 [Brassica carinata]